MVKYQLDDKDKKILMILQKNARETLTNISRKIGLSVDAVHNRIKKMVKHDIFSQTININPRALGYSVICETKVRLKDASRKDAQAFDKYIKNHPRIIEAFRIIGDWDYTIVFIAKDTEDLWDVTQEVRFQFNKIIADWRSVTNLSDIKFEEYDMMKL
jgi:Lrp/AsnC family transcriptional regulator, leucine-responsive regulatory protein